MAVTTFAAIDVGSNEVSMKIFELGKKNKIRELTHVRHILELGSDTYVNGYISNPLINELCEVLKGYTKIMKDFDVSAYKAYSTSSIREANNRHFLLDRIRVRAGLDVFMLSNSEQRFLLYQAISLNDTEFNTIINEGALVVEVGSGSSQATCFSDGKLVVSQNLRLGSIRINEFLGSLERYTDSYADLVKEYIEGDIFTSYHNYFHAYPIKTILAVGEGLRTLQQYINFYHPQTNRLTAKEMKTIYQSLFLHSHTELADIVETSVEQAKLILPTAMIYQQIMNINNADYIQFDITDLCDGIAYEYAIRNGRLTKARNFENDVLSATKQIALRYSSNTKHTNYVEKLALNIFDGITKISGLSIRDRLLLQVAVRLHDCGAYINFQDVATNSYNIISSTEIIGLSRKENKIIASIVKNPIDKFPSSTEIEGNFSIKEYMKIAKLTAIFRVANDLDTSKKQKLTKIKLSVDDDQLILSGETFMDFALEQAFFTNSSNFFEQIYGITPKLKQRRINHV